MSAILLSSSSSTENDYQVQVLQVPNDEWTVEQLMNWCLQEAMNEVQTYYNNTESMLVNEMENEIQQIWENFNNQCTVTVVKNKTDDSKNKNEYSNDENQDMNIQKPIISSQSTLSINRPVLSLHNSTTTTTTDVTTTINATNATGSTTMIETEKATVRVDVIAGPYNGKVYYLRPTSRAACLIGRSTSKRLKEKGISLPNDGEVSTSHGRIEKITTNYYYTDVGSTNGSRYFYNNNNNNNDTESSTKYDIPSHEPIELSTTTSTSIIVGATILSITIL